MLATLAGERTEGLLAAGEPIASAVNSGYHLAYLVGAALVVAALAVAVGALRPASPADAVEQPAQPKWSEPAYSEAA